MCLLKENVTCVQSIETLSQLTRDYLKCQKRQKEYLVCKLNLRLYNTKAASGLATKPLIKLRLDELTLTIGHRPKITLSNIFTTGDQMLATGARSFFALGI